MREKGGGLATLESENCLFVVLFCIKQEVAPRKPQFSVQRIEVARCCGKRLGAGHGSQSIRIGKAARSAADSRGGNCAKVQGARHVGCDYAVKRHRITVPVTRLD